MILLIDGSSHTGKTNLSHTLMKKLDCPYLSIDHLKMGFIRSGKASFNVEDDQEIQQTLWPILVGMIKTAIENKQDLIIEGCYIPKNWKSYFDESYLRSMNYVCLILSNEYINREYTKILKYESVVEKRVDQGISKEELLNDNSVNLELCNYYNLFYIEITERYDLENIVQSVCNRLEGLKK